MIIRFDIVKYREGGNIKDRLKCNSPVRASAGKKQKYTVKACSNGKEKLLHFGLRGMQDYLQHKDRKRRANFRARMRCNTANNKLTRRYWVCNYNW